MGVTVATLDALAEILGRGAADTAVVVASQGHYDEDAVQVSLERGVPYVGLVASRKRGATVRALLEERGVRRFSTLRNPAGLDLGARTPSEVALSILAEIVQMLPGGTALSPSQTTLAVAASEASPAPPATAIDPVCGMSVTVATARHTADIDGVTYYFCCANCRATFVKQPHDAPRPTP